MFITTQPAYRLGPLSARQRNAIRMAFRWRADNGPFLTCLLVVTYQNFRYLTKNIFYDAHESCEVLPNRHLKRNPENSITASWFYEGYRLHMEKFMFQTCFPTHYLVTKRSAKDRGRRRFQTLRTHVTWRTQM